MGFTCFQQREDFCCKMSQSLYKCALAAPPFSLLFLSLPQSPSAPTFTTQTNPSGGEATLSAHSVHPPCGPATPTSLTCNHQGEVKTLLHRFPVDLVRQSGKAHVLLLMVLQGRGGQKQVRVCHHSCLSNRELDSEELKSRRTEVGPCWSSGARRCTHTLKTQGALPGHSHFPGKQWSHHPWRHSRTMEMWHLRTWFIGHGGDGLSVGPDDPRGLFQPESFHDCMIHASLPTESCAAHTGP